MNTINGYTTDNIREAVKEIKKIKPDYALMLDLYEKIYIAQEESKKVIELGDYKIPDAILSVKLEEQFPLINLSEFIIDNNASENLFKSLCSILLETGDELSESVKRLNTFIENKQLDINNLFSEFLHENEDYFNYIENEAHIDKALLGFIIYNSVKPSLSLFSEKVSVYLDKEAVWEKGYCPVCGSKPELSTFEENGKRFLTCGFCSYKWASKRIYCPFCENTDHETMHYYDIDGEEEYRVDTCDKCKKYIKTIDIKKTSRLIYPPLECKATPYIDLKFEEMGFEPGNL